MRRAPTGVDGERRFRDRLTGRTPRSERGDRGSTPCPGSVVHRPERASSSTVERVSYTHGCCWFESSLAHEPDRRRIAQAEERLSDTEEAAGSTPAPPTNTHVTVAQPVERPPETRGVAGSSPAGHIIGRGSVAQTAELPVLTRAVAGSTPAGVTFWKDCHRCGIPSRKRVGFAALGVRLPLLPLSSGVVELARRAVVTREIAGSIPATGARRHHLPPWSKRQ